MRELRSRVGAALRALGLRPTPVTVQTASNPIPSPVALAMLGLLAERRAMSGGGLRLVQVGANPSDGDPVQPVFDLLGRNSRMLLIEAHPAAFVRLSEKYANDDRIVLVNAFVGRPGDGLFALRPEFEDRYQQVKGRPADRISSGHYDWVAQRIANRLGLRDSEVVHALERIDVPVRSLEAICREAGFDSFDVLQIDAEGKDVEILEAFNPVDFGVRIVNFESAELADARAGVISRLEESGFALIADTEDSLCLRLGSGCPSEQIPADV